MSLYSIPRHRPSWTTEYGIFPRPSKSSLSTGVSIQPLTSSNMFKLPSTTAMLIRDNCNPTTNWKLQCHHSANTWMTSSGHVVNNCCPTPLASYLLIPTRHGQRREVGCKAGVVVGDATQRALEICCPAMSGSDVAGCSLPAYATPGTSRSAVPVVSLCYQRWNYRLTTHQSVAEHRHW